MTQRERTVMAFDDQGREYMIDIFTSARELSEMQHAGATGGASAFRTHDGHDATYLGNGEFMIMVPGEEGGVTVRTDDSEFV
ncbi:hypothetical protein HOP62_09025 [Halomonas sp. MCCC 1A17488]|uniref:Uncharacterized protein n=1 Tax=Billgrantia sulfidoxydans TaxID=2733484 RepID=A0ABX7W3A2_9GAMM|nr:MULTISPECIES: hypothetical protein [Halomonas]MCE8016219.1 hypothetical protein [Halomonas sp. MCCC 1A17488]MCG3239552.1 hypothetical protein [Halomonas sp. MCCC 1A17488]QPP50528.1 hypothetical protein I4484_05355 [Halomonas sp. SS10-MC5]QTP54117.1 hypothetical protein HNO51_05130 [Halomonas sulfidoxydans]